ncbi:L-lactate dehydrogenase-like isoform X2 [Artemia franciscana]|uniref:L-lactate dehydrogenase-like isoform X2 n=1 Tax=Artemia franciscana TaxID=6661 RepID=UPI0032DA6F83
MFMYSMVPILWYSLVMGAFCLPVEEDLWKSYDLVHKGLSKLLLSLFAFNRVNSGKPLREKLMHDFELPSPLSGGKVTIVGLGHVGMACAISILSQNIASELVLVDRNPDKLRGETLDLQHGLAFVRNAQVYGDTQYSATAGSKLCIVTAGVPQGPGDSRTSLAPKNLEIFKEIIPRLVKYSPETILLIVTNPVDTLAYAAWKLSGFPANRVIGSGTNLDSSRFRFLLSQRLKVVPSICHGWIIGEHGDSSIPIWSDASLAGVRLRDVDSRVGTKKDVENWSQLHQEVVGSAQEIIKLKGYTSWGIGLSVAALTRAILENSQSSYAVSTLVQGIHDISEDVFLSVPCILGDTGVSRIILQTLNSAELADLHNCAKSLYEIQKSLHF